MCVVAYFLIKWFEIAGVILSIQINPSSFQDLWGFRVITLGVSYYVQVWPGETVFPDYTKQSCIKWWVDEIIQFHKQVNHDAIWIVSNPVEYKYWSQEQVSTIYFVSDNVCILYTKFVAIHKLYRHLQCWFWGEDGKQ